MDKYTVMLPKSIVEYYSRNSLGEHGITVDLIMSAIMDRMAGYHISYSATELLKELGFLTQKKNITKKAVLMVSHELHSRYHNSTPRIKLEVEK